MPHAPKRGPWAAAICPKPPQIGRDQRSVDDLHRMLRDHTPGLTTVLHVIRRGARIAVAITPELAS